MALCDFLFCCDGCLLSFFFIFFFFHLNCQLLFREQKGWQVCAPDPDGHSTKRELVREPGLVLCSL